MTLAIYPGSFDPITNGHLDVLERASKLFDKVVISVLHNGQKNAFLTVSERIELIKQSVVDIKNVEVDCFEGLTVEYVKKMNANVIIRGLRAVSDFEYEMQLAQMNKTLASEIETIFLVPKAKYNFISSSIIREVSRLGGDITTLVPKPVLNYFENLNKAR